jgi:isopenicillin N synthase-like dioxygenase
MVLGSVDLGPASTHQIIIDHFVTHGYILLPPTPTMLRKEAAVDAAARELFGQNASARAGIDAAMRARIAALHGAAGGLPYPAELHNSLFTPGLHTAADHARAHGALALAPQVRPAPAWGYARDNGRLLRNYSQLHVVCDPRARAAYPWPAAAAPRLAAAVEAYAAELAELCERLLVLLAPGLAARRAAAVVARGDPSVLDLFEYAGGAEQAMEEMAPHVDPGLFTCKYVGATQVPGLEVLDQATGRYVGEGAFRGRVVCFVNQVLADWCLANGGPALRPAQHRVVSGPAGRLARVSVVYELRAPVEEDWLKGLEDWAARQREAMRYDARRERARRRQRRAEVERQGA